MTQPLLQKVTTFHANLGILQQADTLTCDSSGTSAPECLSVEIHIERTCASAIVVQVWRISNVAPGAARSGAAVPGAEAVAACAAIRPAGRGVVAAAAACVKCQTLISRAVML